MPSSERPHPERPYGWRATLGLIVPPTNSVNEAEWMRMLPDGVTMHVARMPLHLDTASEAGWQALRADLARAGGDLAAADVDVIAYGCTAGSLALPLDRLTGLVTAETGTPAVATAPAIVAALRQLGATRIALATPYHAALNDHEAAFLTACGFAIVSVEGLGHGAGGAHEFKRIARVASGEVEALVAAADRDDADAIVLSCTDLASLAVHERLEARHGKPVVSSNQATLWAALRAAGVTERIGWGALLSSGR